MTIIITGNEGEFLYSIVTDGEKCSIVEQDTEKVRTRYGKISIDGGVSLAAKLAVEKAQLHAQFACGCAEESKSDAYESSAGCYPQGAKTYRCKNEATTEDVARFLMVVKGVLNTLDCKFKEGIEC